jgi:hypothetical protein
VVRGRGEDARLYGFITGSSPGWASLTHPQVLCHSELFNAVKSGLEIERDVFLESGLRNVDEFGFQTILDVILDYG